MVLKNAVLSLLTFRAMSGYDLKKMLDSTIGHIWSTTQSHIYKVLHELESTGLVTAKEIEQRGRPNRKLYTITSKGEKELQQWWTTPLECDPVREAWLIQIYFAHLLKNEQITHLFEAKLQELEERLATCEEQKPYSSDTTPPFTDLLDERMHELRQMTIDFGKAYYQFQINWHKKALDRIKHLPPMENKEE